MRNPFAPPLLRLRVKPDDPKSLPARLLNSRRPHGDAAVAQVRKLIENSTLTYSEIAERTGVGRASICRWTRDQNWQRPHFAPRATDSVPSARASAKLKRRTLAARLQALAERTVAEMEATPGVDLEKLAEALMLMRMIKLAARPKRRRTGNARAIPGAQRTALDYEDTASVMARLRAAGIDPARAPEAAVKDFIESHAPPRDFPELRPRGRTSRRVREHRRMLEPDRK